MKRKTLLRTAAAVACLTAVAAGTYWLLAVGRHAPLYAWVTIGPDGDRKLLVRTRGEFATVELQDANGVVLQRWSKSLPQLPATDFDFDGPDGRTRYSVRKLYAYGDRDRPGEALMGLTIHVSRPDSEHGEYVHTSLRRDPAATDTDHIDGPREIRPREPDPARRRLVAGGRPTELAALVGTMGPVEWRSLVEMESRDEPTFPPGVAPVAEIEFSPKRPGGPAVKRRYTLDHFC